MIHHRTGYVNEQHVHPLFLAERICEHISCGILWDDKVKRKFQAEQCHGLGTDRYYSVHRKDGTAAHFMAPSHACQHEYQSCIGGPGCLCLQICQHKLLEGKITFSIGGS